MFKGSSVQPKVTQCDISMSLDGSIGRTEKMIQLSTSAMRMPSLVNQGKSDGQLRLPIYTPDETLRGTLTIKSGPKSNYHVEHAGIQLEYIGEIRIVSHVEASPGLAKTWPFLTMKQIIAGPAYIVQKPLIVPFEFKQIASTTQLMSPSQWTGHAAILSIDQTPPVLLSPRSYDPASADDLKPSNANANTNTNFNSSVVKSLCIESYYGDIVQCRYYLRCTILRNKAFQSNWVREMDIFIEERPRSDSTAPLVTSGLSMRYLQSDLRAAASSALRLEFGLDRLLHLQFSCIEAQYDVEACIIIGQVDFLEIKIKLQSMELQLVVREFVNYAGRTYTHQRLLKHHEICHGSPGGGDVIPFRFIVTPSWDTISKTASRLSSMPRPQLSPTFASIHQKFSVRYYLNLILKDEHARKYFKQQEIFLHRPPSMQTVC